MPADDIPPSTNLTTPTTRLNTATARRPGQLRIRVVGGKPAEFELDNGSTITFGRSRAAKVVIDHPSVSKLHFCLRALDGGVELEDLGSKNGTWFQERRARRITLMPGDTFWAGSCEIEILGLDLVDVEVLTDNECGLLFGESVVMREMFAKIEKLASLPLDLLIHGESGTGKELIARTVHNLSPRRDRPFVILDCSTLPLNFADAVMFGFCRGAFTGAEQERPGLFEQADGGTLFIDEIGELPLELQMKFLGALDRRQVARLGEPGRVRDINVRVIAATHRDLNEEVAAKRFRNDLFHRIAHGILRVPPLRDRGVDVALLAERFLHELSLDHDGPKRFSDDANTVMVTYDWPGNVRELKNAVRRTALMCSETVIRPDHLDLGRPHGWGFDLAKALEDKPQNYESMHLLIDRLYLPAILDEHKTITATAEHLGVTRARLRSRLQTLGLYGSSNT